MSGCLACAACRAAPCPPRTAPENVKRDLSGSVSVLGPPPRWVVSCFLNRRTFWTLNHWCDFGGRLSDILIKKKCICTLEPAVQRSLAGLKDLFLSLLASLYPGSWLNLVFIH